jgi:hypothetical protein
VVLQPQAETVHEFDTSLLEFPQVFDDLFVVQERAGS